MFALFLLCFNAFFVFAGGLACCLFKDVVEMGYGIEIQLSCDVSERLITAYQLLCLIDFQLEIGLVNTLSRLCLEEGTKVGFAVV